MDSAADLEYNSPHRTFHPRSRYRRNSFRPGGKSVYSDRRHSNIRWSGSTNRRTRIQTNSSIGHPPRRFHDSIRRPSNTGRDTNSRVLLQHTCHSNMHPRNIGPDRRDSNRLHTWTFPADSNIHHRTVSGDRGIRVVSGLESGDGLPRYHRAEDCRRW